MDEIIRSSLYEVTDEERIQATFAASDIVTEVFPEEETRLKFLGVLADLIAEGACVQVGGRRTRSLIGCKTLNLSDSVVNDANDERDSKLLRLGPNILKALDEYPTDRMSNPDLDFFLFGIEQDRVVQILQRWEFDPKVCLATGGVWVIDVPGTCGTVTFVDGAKSWQTADRWPKYAIRATLFDDDGLKFKIDTHYFNMFFDPLAIAIVNSSSTDPQSVAAVARGLLWGVTSTDPSGRLIRAPQGYFKNDYIIIVSHFYFLLKRIENNPELMIQYRSAVRDMALALRIIVLTDWDYLESISKVPKEDIWFYKYIAASWQNAFISDLYGKGEEFLASVDMFWR